MPAEAVLAASIHVGACLDREQLRVLRRELRSRDALDKAARLLARRDLSERGLDSELARRGVTASTRNATVARLVDAGAVDDGRLAARRAEQLGARSGDALIRADLEERGLDGEIVELALGSLIAEEERARAVVSERGAGLKTARYLARRGFAEESIEAALDGDVAETP